MRILKAGWAYLGLVLLLLVAPVQAQQGSMPETEWQAAISGQIEALRQHDGKLALSFAAESFRANFTDPAGFMAAIVATGYAPIIESRSHQFGRFEQVSPEFAVQEVKLVGAKQELYEVIYQMRHEADGWRVFGVQLLKRPGIGI